MSSYHILNSIWIGVFPMLAVTVIIGVLFYIVCCLNRIKKHCGEYCAHKRIEKSRRNLNKKTPRDIEASYQSDDQYKSKKKKKKISEIKNSMKCFQDPYDEQEEGYREEKSSSAI